MNKFQIFWLNFSLNMSRMHYFCNKFSKTPSAGGSPLPVPLLPLILMIWSCVIWPNCVFSNWLWQNRTLKISY